MKSEWSLQARGIASLLFTLIVLLPALPLHGVQTPPLPLYADVATPLPVVNVGPGAPMVLEPGSCAVFTLIEEFAGAVITGGYIWRVGFSGEELNVFNYTVSVRKVEREVEVCLPPDTEMGVYDIVLYGDVETTIPRAVWVANITSSRLRIAVVSDLHFGVVGRTDLWRFSAGVITNALSPDLVIWAGDIQDVDSEYHARIAQVYRYIMYYSHPVFSVPGNHDNPGSNYARFLGPTRWVRELSGKLLIVGLYTNPHFEPGNIVTWDEIVFLEEALRNYSHLPYKIIVTHYPMFYCREPCIVRASYDDEEVLKPFERGVETPVSSYWSVNMTAFRYVLKLIEDYNVTAVVSGHIHQDQYIVYVSTRTNTTTHFITVTSSGQTTPTYPGVRVLELNLDSGELKLLEHPNVGINSIPIERGAIGVEFRMSRGTEAYRMEIHNNIPWLNISFRLVLPIPWNGQNIPRIEVRKPLDGTVVKVKPAHVQGLFAYLGVELNLPPGAGTSIVVYRDSDLAHPSIALTRLIPETPRLNRTLTLHLSVVDDSWGINPWSLDISVNCTPKVAVTLTPGTYYAVFNRVSVELRFTPISINTTICRLDIRVSDNADKESLKSYLITVYPPGVTPVGPPIIELKHEDTTTPPIEETVPEPVNETQTMPETTFVPGEKPTPTTQTTETVEPSPLNGLRRDEVVHIAVLLVGVLVIAIAFYIIRSRATASK